MSIKVYKLEENLGLAQKIKDSAKACVIASVITDKNDKIKIAKAVDYYKDKEMQDWQKQYLPQDCAMVNCILVTTDWNKNDDVFTSSETWSARNTPVMKPANIGHIGREGVGNQIVGVIGAASTVDDNYDYIYHKYQDGMDVPPDYFNILCSVYLWQTYFPDAVGNVLKGVDEGKMFVSMECVFADFGYALKKEGVDNVDLLARNDITSWLTPYLKAYGGNGQVSINGVNYQIGRWLRNLRFSGVGFVDDPANPTSIIFKDYITNASRNMKFTQIDENFSANYVTESKIILKDECDLCVLKNDSHKFIDMGF